MAARQAPFKLTVSCKTCGAAVQTAAIQRKFCESCKVLRHRVANNRKSAAYSRTIAGRYFSLVCRHRARFNAPPLSLVEYSAVVTNASCYYCSEALPEVGAGLDRINNKLGYTQDNVIACCTACNLGRGRLTFDEFKAVIRLRVDNGTL